MFYKKKKKKGHIEKLDTEIYWTLGKKINILKRKCHVGINVVFLNDIETV
jgi:hypothetical protein